MLKYILHTQAMNLHYAEALVKDIPADKMCAQPSPGMNHPAWVLGHMASAADFTASLVGQKPALPKPWEKLFGTGTKPLADAKLYPSKAELVKAVEDGYARAAKALANVKPEQLEKPFPVEEMRAGVPTVGDGLIFLATAHDAVHLGQLSAWRRAMGLPQVTQ